MGRLKEETHRRTLNPETNQSETKNLKKI